MRNPRRFSWRRLSAYVGLCLCLGVVIVLTLIAMFGGAILNKYGKARFERAFAAAHPGCALTIGEMHYALITNRLDAQAVTLTGPKATLKVGRISLTGVRWTRFASKTASLADALAGCSLDAMDLEAEFPGSRYGIRCARLHASVPVGDLKAEGTELRPLIGDEAFFAANAFRTTRARVVVPECTVLGVAYGELLKGESYRAASVHLSGPSFDALVNRDKPGAPFLEPPLMVHEALAAIHRPLQVDRLSITNGLLRYSERVMAGAEPGVLTFTAVNIAADGIANRGGPAAAIRLQAQGNLMDAGVLKVLMTIPVAPPDFSLHYSGSLGAMDLTRLNAFLDAAVHTRIKSGTAREVEFDINVAAGRARGRVSARYKDLVVALLDKQTGTESGLGNRAASLLVNVLKIRNSSAADALGPMAEGEVNYTRQPEDTFLQCVWFALRSGVLDVISH